ncbi:hypothetical protein MASR2M117_19030 [Paludibacter sp.]
MKFIISYYKTIIATVIILFLSFAKFPPINDLPVVPNTDKIIHFLMYMSLSVIALVDTYKIDNLLKKRSQLIIVCLIFPLVLAIITELIQSIPAVGRSGDPYDWLSNTIGVLSGWGIYYAFKKLLKT